MRRALPRAQSPRPRRRLIGAALALLLAGAPALAQDTTVRLGQSLRISGSALEVTADQLDVDQSSGASVFSGNVMAVQGELRLSAGDLRLEYSPLVEGQSRRIERLVASGGVTMVTPAEAIEAREAVYQLGAGTLEMQGDVMLVQGPNILTGQSFTVDLQSGSGRISGRVRTVIQLD